MRARRQIHDRVDIDQRPAIVEERSRLGKRVLDTVIGSELVTAVERRSYLMLIGCCHRSTAVKVAADLVRILCLLRAQVPSITVDNSRGFTRHAEVASQLQCEFYFAKLYQSGQSKLNENINDLIRRYFPKDTGIRKNQIKTAGVLLNLRTWKCLNYKALSGFFDSDVATVR